MGGEGKKRRAKALYHVKCQRCGREFSTLNIRRLYCSPYCRRQFQNEERKAARAELRQAEAEQKAFTPWSNDPWAVNDLDNLESIYANALNDGWTGTPCGLTMCPDEAAGGPMACATCTRYAGDEGGRLSSYGLPAGDPAQGAGMLPSGKKVAKAKRRRRKRLEAGGKLEGSGPAVRENQTLNAEKARQDQGKISGSEGGQEMAEKNGAGYMADMAADALRIVNGERQREYGDPERNFMAVANLWNAYLAGIDHFLTTADVANMMILFKLARNMTGSGKQDTDVDLIGYALLSADMRQKRAARRKDAEDEVRDVQQ